MNTAIATSPTPKAKRKATRNQPNTTKMYLVKTLEMKRAEALEGKKMFFDLGLSLTEEKVGKFFTGSSGAELLGIYFEQELKSRENLIGRLDESEWNDDPDGCTPEQYGLKLAKSWREDFFKTGAPCEGDYIWNFFFYHKKFDEKNILLFYYLQKEMSNTKYSFIEAENTEFEYI